jgi:predicted ATP-dependent protease
MAPETASLSPEALRWRCDPAGLGFATTRELEPLVIVEGSRRWIEAMNFGIAVRRPEYNLFAIGSEGIGKSYLTQHVVEEHAAGEAPPDDWCYVYNFVQAHVPNALRLPAGRGRAFRSDVERLLSDLREVLTATFEGEEYRSRRQLIEQELKERQENALAEIDREASEKSIAFLKTPMGFSFAPVRDGNVIQPQAYQALSEAERKEIEDTIKALQEKLQAALQEFPLWTKQGQDKMHELIRETANYAVSGLIQGLREKYHDVPEVPGHLDSVKEDMVANAGSIVQMTAKMEEAGVSDQPEQNPLLRRYGVNLLVDNAELKHAPVVHEENPTYDRLIGRIEHRSEQGALVTDFQLIRPGALHKANGGYLMIDARQLLSRPLAYEALKRAIRGSTIEIEPMAQLYGLPSTITLQPESIPLDVKVVLLGERQLYYMLSQLDPEFPELFKIVADFDEDIERTEGALGDYVRLIAGLAEDAGVRPVDASGVALLCEHSARMAGDFDKLSLHREALRDVLIEADYWAGQVSRGVISGDDVRKALEKREFRLDRIRERIQEEIGKGTIRIETDGEAVGQMNGLSVSQIGDFAFGRPSRITAQVRLGSGDVVDIEREVKLGGPLHSKGVLILSGYLGAKFGTTLPLSLSATLVFEQSYGGVDGDSASAAELITLLSAIAEVPIAQSFAMTGSVDQTGRVQAIGGVNQKIEGFFDVCAAGGLSGHQGVLIPATNIRHLMLHDRVVDAARDGRFGIYAVETIDQAIEILTGLTAGVPDDKGEYPEGTFHAKVAARLRELAEARRRFAPAAQRSAAAQEE